MSESMEGSGVAEASAVGSTSHGGKYLTLKLGLETYGVDVLRIQEIIGAMNVTSVPQTPEFVKGVINLRGKVIPVIDLRLKFGMNEIETTQETCIIVINVGATLMGVIVDTVHEVVDIEDAQIEEPPQFGAKVDTAFILGMGKLEGRVVILLDIQRVLSSEELVVLSDMGNDQVKGE